ncbi:MAG: hypothetical protein QW685_09875 [Saccharolobus sp.]
MKESYLIPIISTISYYILGLLVIILYTNSAIDYVLFAYTPFIIKSFDGKGNALFWKLKPLIINVIKWSFLNSIIQMNIILIMTPSISLFLLLQQ